MNKKLGIIIIVLYALIATGCGNLNYTKNNNNNNGKEESKISCSINNNNGKYDYYINESLVCPQFNDIAYSGDRFFITNSGELYEYSDKKYSTTNNNCKKVESDVLFSNIIANTLVSKDGNFYSYHDGNLKKISDDEIEKGRAWYGIDQMEIKVYRVNNKIFYLDQLDNEAPEIYGYVDGNSIYSISYDWKLNKTNEKLLITFKDGEKVEKVTNGFVITNKGYYRYGMTNQKKCSEYEDIKCEYGLVQVDTTDNCSNEIFYVSNNLIVTQNMVK